MAERSSGLFYGWRIVAVAFLTLFISVGFSFYSYGAFFKALADEFGGSRLGVSLGQSLLFVVMGLLSPWIGREVDRRSIRNLVLVGAALVGAGFLLVSRIQALWHFYALYGSILALGLALMGQIPVSALVANWFVRRRGMALGVATMGISMSGVVMAPVATMLIESVGWRGTFVVYALLTLVVIAPPVWATVIDRPEDVGLHPDGSRDAPDAEPGERVIALASGEPPSGLVAGRYSSAGGLITDRNFWIIAITVSLNFCSNGAILTHMIPHVTDLGFTPTRAALVLSTAAGLGVAGKIVFGWIADRLDLRLAFSLAMVLQILSVVALTGLAEEASYSALLVVGAVFGLGMGGLVPLWGSMIGAAFGRRSFGRAMGLMGPVMIPLQVAGIPYAGLVFDRFGSYAPAFRTFIAIYCAALLILALLRLPRGPVETSPAG